MIDIIGAKVVILLEVTALAVSQFMEVGLQSPFMIGLSVQNDNINYKYDVFSQIP